MKDEAKKWLLALPAGSLITWEAVETKFFSRYYPSWKTREIRGKIATFEEELGEAFHETWDRFKLLLAQCLHHMFPFVLLVQCFYDGLTGLTQATVDNACGGAMREKPPAKYLPFMRCWVKIPKNEVEGMMLMKRRPRQS